MWRLTPFTTEIWVLFLQLVCNADLTFSHVDARYPGSANDAHVLRMSPLSIQGENGGFNGYVILGDSGYFYYIFVFAYT